MENLRVTVEEQLQQLQALMHRATFSSHMERYNPHRGQGRVLALLKMKPEISQKELSFLLNTSKQSLAELISKLEKRELITREPSEEDKRVMMVKLTEQGVQEAESIATGSPESAEALDCLTDEELATFSEYLGRIIAYYEEQFPDEDFEQRRKSMEDFMRHHGRGHGAERPGHYGDRGNHAGGPGFYNDQGRRGKGRGSRHGQGHDGGGHGYHNQDFRDEAYGCRQEYGHGGKGYGPREGCSYGNEGYRHHLDHNQDGEGWDMRQEHPGR